MGEILREARLDKGMTLRDVVDISFVSLAMLSELERGVKEASSLIVAQVAGALDIPLSKLYLDTARELYRLGQ
jgi:transcriptional regulator with XRE-family HTH domain